MTINIDNSNTKVTRISVMGRVDSNTYSELQEVINRADYSREALVIDFKDVEYISSAGLRVLLSGRKKKTEGEFKIINVSDEVYEIFEMTGFSSILDIERGKEGIATFISRSFKERLKARVEKSPDTVFISHLGEDYTWQDIEKCAQIAAHDLFKLGVKKVRMSAFVPQTRRTGLLLILPTPKSGINAVKLTLYSLK